MKYLLFSLLLILGIAQLSAQEFKTITVAGYSTTIKDKRLALVIGNNEYSEVSKLSNPINDAKAIKTALEACGFDVIIHENGTEKSIKEKVREFSDKLKSYDVGMFYYSGHGIEVNGINYIAPVDIVGAATAADMTEDCVATEFILNKMGEAGQTDKTYIMVLDACRDNPFKNIFKDLGSQIWKAPSVVPSGSIICYAASQGQTAREGEKLSPYTELFLKHIKTPGLRIEDVFIRVRNDLAELKKINPQLTQEPVEMNKLNSVFYFVPAKEGTNPEPDTKPGNTNNDLATLKILSTANGTIKIDGVQKGSIKANDVKIYDLKPGNYIVQLITDGDNVSFNKEVDLTAAKTKFLNFEILSKIPIKTESNKQETNGVVENGRIIKVNGQNIEFYPEDLGQMNWQDAKKACKKLGNGWRLPDWPEMEQIKTLFHDKGKGNFKSEFYINSAMQDNKVIPYLYNMKTGAFDQWGFNKEYSQKRAFVRPVRNI